MMKLFGICAVLLSAVPWAKALPQADYFEPDLTMYSLADFGLIRPMAVAVLPITMTTFAASVPLFAAGSGRDSVDRSYDILVGDVSQFAFARPLGSFFEWENRDRTRPVVIKFLGEYTIAELSPQQERRYRTALKEHEERIAAIEREPALPEGDRQALVASEERRWENILRLLLSL